MRQITFTEGEYYHLYNRGVDKRRVFTSPTEYNRFLAYLLVLNSTQTRSIQYALATKDLRGLASQVGSEKAKPLVAIGAYCLMPNHFHLYVTPLVEDGISRFMQRVQTGYTMYFNEKHKRTGALFQGTFKAQHVGTDNHAKYLFSYIHLNPAKLKDPNWKEFGTRDFRGLREYVRSYPYSSLGEYLSRAHIISNPTPFPQYLSNMREVDHHVDSWLHYRQKV